MSALILDGGEQSL